MDLLKRDVKTSQTKDGEDIVQYLRRTVGQKSKDSMSQSHGRQDWEDPFASSTSTAQSNREKQT